MICSATLHAACFPVASFRHRSPCCAVVPWTLARVSSKGALLGPLQHASQAKRLCVRASPSDEAAADTDPAAAAATATATAADAVDPLRARRLQRQQRRAARRTPSESQEPADSGTLSTAAAQDAAETTSRKPVSRIAARRQQRSRAFKRVPAATVPDDDDLQGEDDEEEEEEEEDNDSDADVAVQEAYDWDASGPTAADTGEAEQAQDADEAAAAGDADEDESRASSMQQLPPAVVEALQARRTPKPQPSSSDSGSSESGQQAQQQQQPQQQQRRQEQGAARPEPINLYEANPMYQPVLTDEDLENDPPGHKSGYVAVIGRPNAGKSTLINAIVGQKLSIVTFKPQTTRHRVVGIASGDDYQMILFDTPGIMQEQRSKLDERMMAAVVSSIKAAEVIIAVVDSADSPQEALAMFQPGPDWNGPPMAVLLNKADRLQSEQVAELEAWYKANCRTEQVFVGSALSSSDDGVAAVKAWAISKLPEGPTLYPKSMVSEQPERFFVSEIIREQIFLQYEQEIPYSCQVQIAEFKEHPGAKDYIRALILVERESQAPIVLGAGGKAIKKLGSAARQQIEEFLGRKVYLELSVQVAPGWRQQSDKLKDFGYFDPLYIT